MTDTPIYQEVLEWILRGRTTDMPAWPTADPDAWEGPTVPRFLMPAEMFIEWPEVEHTPGEGDSLFRPSVVALTDEQSRYAA